MPLIIIAAGVALLLVLMIGFKVNGFIALVLVAAVVGFCRRDGRPGRFYTLYKMGSAGRSAGWR